MWILHNPTSAHVQNILVCLICIPYPWSFPSASQAVCFSSGHPDSPPACQNVYVHVCSVCVCVCVNLSVNQILGAQNASPCMTHTGCLRCTMRSQKGGELGLSILGCELQQWLDKAASGSQPITSLRSVFHSYGCMIGPGVAGRGMDKWSPFTESEREWSPTHSPILMYTQLNMLTQYIKLFTCIYIYILCTLGHWKCCDCITVAAFWLLC